MLPPGSFQPLLIAPGALYQPVYSGSAYAEYTVTDELTVV